MVSPTISKEESLSTKDSVAYRDLSTELIQSTCTSGAPSNDDKRSGNQQKENDSPLQSHVKEKSSETITKVGNAKQMRETLPLNRTTAGVSDSSNKGEKESQPNSIPKDVTKPEQSNEDNRDVFLTSEQIEKVSKRLIEYCQDFTVSQLEDVHSSVAKIIWKSRSAWDKTDTVGKIMKFLSE